jgi:hypothetical protein
MSEDKNKQLEELRLDTKIEGLSRVLESLRDDKWSDVANLGKNTYAACVKEEISLREEKKAQFARLVAFGKEDAARKFVQSEISNTPKRLPGKQSSKSKRRHSNG